jgi:hypothetical protein
LNECISTGEQIVEVLRSFAKDPRQVCYSGTYHIEVEGVPLDALVNQQCANLDALDGCLRDYSEIVRALDARVYVELQQFVAFKGVGLAWIATLFQRGMIPFDALDLRDIDHLAQYSQFMLREESVETNDVGPVADRIVDFLPWYHEVAVISRRMDAGAFKVAELFEEGDYHVDTALKAEELKHLEDFLKTNDLKHHLYEAKRHLNQIGEFIKDNFSVAELMIDVGSEQLKKKASWPY